MGLLPSRCRPVVSAAPENWACAQSRFLGPSALPCLANPLGTPGTPGLEGTTSVPSHPVFPPLSSQLLYLKLILNFLFEETK